MLEAQPFRLFSGFVFTDYSQVDTFLFLVQICQLWRESAGGAAAGGARARHAPSRGALS